MVFEGWRHLCLEYGPIFVESRLILFQWSALEANDGIREKKPDIDFFSWVW